jgi:hypothetical protein
MNKVIAFAPAIAVVVTAAGLFGYAIALLLAAFFYETPLGDTLHTWFMESPAANIGIPCSAISAFAIVAVLLRAFPPGSEKGKLTFKAFGLQFEGPSGPITLWLMCFLGFVFAMRLLRTSAG